MIDKPSCISPPRLICASSAICWRPAAFREAVVERIDIEAPRFRVEDRLQFLDLAGVGGGEYRSRRKERELRPEVDELFALMTPELFSGVSRMVWDFSRTSDAEVTDLLKRARSFAAEGPSADAPETGKKE